MCAACDSFFDLEIRAINIMLLTLSPLSFMIYISSISWTRAYPFCMLLRI